MESAGLWQLIMKLLAVHNPFNAPVYHEETVTSTMDVSRILALRGEPHGTVITAGFQTSGRGRVKGRSWIGSGGNLACTILLRFPGIEGIPRALTLRTGLAVSLAIEDCAPALSGKVMVKWPNDVLISGAVPAAAKAAGILTEADGGNVHIGIGVNAARQQFPDFLQGRATSIGNAAGREMGGECHTLLEKILIRLHAGIYAEDWHERLESRLYKKGEIVCFAEGPADSGKTVTGILAGIGPEGELLIMPPGSPAGSALSFTTGELLLPWPGQG